MQSSQPDQLYDAGKLWERANKNREAEVNAFLVEKEFHDVSFLVGEDKIPVSASRYALASISPVFCAMLFGQMKESDRDALIHIPDIDPEVLQCIVRFSNGVNPSITEENCVEIKYLTQKYQIKSLDQELDDFIVGCLREENFCAMFCAVHNTHISSLVEKCMGKLKALCDFSVLLASQGFLNLSVDQMKLLVSSDLFVVSEEMLWKYCVKWAKHKVESAASCENPENTQAFYLKQIKHGIRFTFLSTEFILQEVHPENTLTDSEIVAVLSDINCPSFLMKSNFCCKVRHSLQPTSYFVYGAGSEIVNGRYEYKGHFVNDYNQELTVYTRVASDGKKLGLYQTDSADWWVSIYSGHITVETAHKILHFQGADITDIYQANGSGILRADEAEWETASDRGKETGKPPVPKIRALGRCFPLHQLPTTPTETP